MRVKILLAVGLLGAVFTTSDAFANAGGGGRHNNGGGNTSSSVSATSFTTENGTTSGTTAYVGVPEPSSMYAFGSALSLLGATGWLLRRKS